MKIEILFGARGAGDKIDEVVDVNKITIEDGIGEGAGELVMLTVSREAKNDAPAKSCHWTFFKGKTTPYQLADMIASIHLMSTLFTASAYSSNNPWFSHSIEILETKLPDRTLYSPMLGYRCYPDMTEQHRSGFMCSAHWVELRQMFGLSATNEFSLVNQEVANTLGTDDILHDVGVPNSLAELLRIKTFKMGKRSFLLEWTNPEVNDHIHGLACVLEKKDGRVTYNIVAGINDPVTEKGLHMFTLEKNALLMPENRAQIVNSISTIYVSMKDYELSKAVSFDTYQMRRVNPMYSQPTGSNAPYAVENDYHDGYNQMAAFHISATMIEAGIIGKVYEMLTAYSA